MNLCTNNLSKSTPTNLAPCVENFKESFRTYDFEIKILDDLKFELNNEMKNVERKLEHLKKKFIEYNGDLNKEC